ncbi:hypothetical protein BCR34DRAFT_556542 [Clohesyomyces aquaticus]|uniref:F-box domain-containing protein n=1 Tax=Clohesyomyces aquaticus TaxID=1231657 RepID=A0A1Y2A371_9PLEO|nr:hypothetical protein BCR34DRAFT_556542 [Clohesyomyces aquaticus]
MPTSPSYLLPTAASRSRSIRNDSDNKTPSPPKKLKRPSALSDNDRVLLRAKSFTIKPANPSTSCPLASLPVEIRVRIYRYTLQGLSGLIDFRQGGVRLPVPKLLHVSRAIRCEAAYEWYRWGPFSTYIYRLDFMHIKEWVKRQPTPYRGTLAKNTNLELEMELFYTSYGWWGHWDRYPSTFAGALWKECRQFGNIYSAGSAQHKDHFVQFCRWANWLLWCEKYIPGGLTWTYKLTNLVAQTHPLYVPSASLPGKSKQQEYLEQFLERTLATFQLPCVVSTARINHERKAVLKKSALRMLEGLDRQYSPIPTLDAHSYWVKRVVSLRRFLEEW